MKGKLALLGMMSIVALTLMACGGAENTAELNQKAVNVPCDDFSEQGNVTSELTVAVGDTFTVTLCSNPTTGFQWSEVAQIGDENVLEQVSHEYVAHVAEVNETPVMGAPGNEVWTFNALGKGTTTVSMEYSRPWEGGEKGVWTFVLTVAVE
jgi:inhibitor of cysteine peptidase